LLHFSYVQVRKFMTAPGLRPITALCFKATIRTDIMARQLENLTSARHWQHLTFGLLWGIAEN
jgi:hypothetical protein